MMSHCHMYWISILSFVMTALASLEVHAQADSTSVQLPIITVLDSTVRSQYAPASSQIWQSSSQPPMHDLGRFLNAASGIFIKSFGGSGIATSSIRGSSAEQTLLLWNGVPIQNPMLGQVDLSLIQPGLMDKIGLIRGGHSSKWGSAAIGGVITLDNSPDWSEGSQAGLSMNVGSFGFRSGKFHMDYGNGEWSSRTRISHHQSENDFRFLSRRGNSHEKLTHAAKRQQDIMQSFGLRLDPKTSLTADVWYQESDREVPPTLVQNVSNATFEDKAWRSLLRLQHQGAQSIYWVKASYISENQEYYDQVENINKFQSVFIEVEHQKQGNESLFNLGISFLHNSANTHNYIGKESENRISFFTNHTISGRIIDLDFSLRQTLIDGTLSPILPAAGAIINLSSKESVSFKINRNFRVPTLNNRYWQPGGTPDLEKEKGWSQEVTFSTRRKRLALDLIGFNRNIKNWILWAFNPGDNFVSAQNVAHVWSRGLESRITFEIPIAGGLLTKKFGYDFIRSTNQSNNPLYDEGQQLFYTPEHKFHFTIGFQKKVFELRYQHIIVGNYDGINDSLPGYNIGSIQLSYQSQYKKTSFRGFISIENIWNHSYQVIERRPMPGTHFTIGSKINLE